MEIYVDYDDFIIIKNKTTEKYYCLDLQHDEHCIYEVELIYRENNKDKTIEELLNISFDFDYSGEELNGTGYLYFKKV